MRSNTRSRSVKLISKNHPVFHRMVLALAIGLAMVVLSSCSGGGEPSRGSGEVSPDGVLSAELSEFEIAGNLVAVPGEVTIDVENVGSIVHNLIVVDEARTSDLDSGASEVLDVGILAEGTYTIICDIPGHLEAGMETTLVVVGDD
jgi:plastocyanin